MEGTEIPEALRHAPRTKNEIRCVCRFAPLLAVYGLDARDRLYVHIRIYKKTRLYGNVVLRGGPVEIQCRDCFRWHVINFRDNRPVTEIRQTNDDTVASSE